MGCELRAHECKGWPVVLDCDFLIVGSGLAGLNAAIPLAQHGKVIVVTKRQVGDSATSYAQGGIASVWSGDDSLQAHAEDTMEAGAGLCDRAAVESILADGPQAVQQLIDWGVRFDRRQDGDEYDLTREGGHSARRILHAQDITGREIHRIVRQRAAAAGDNILQLCNHIVIDLLVTDKFSLPGPNRCVGAYILNSDSGVVETVRARATLLATGGVGKVYLYTSNPDVATGDGVAMAYRAGAQVANMEFLQFHPTCLFHPRAKSFLISEALRGEGGILRRRDGTPLMRGVHPLADLAPRDIVARAIDSEMKRSGEEFVTLDMSHHDPAFIASRFPNIHTACLALGIDMTQKPIPVVPAAHYMCGGIATDLRGASTLQGLWVAGESAYTGLHGANRLASNSLLEAAVMSARAAADMALVGAVGQPLPKLPPWDSGGASDPDEAVVVSHNWDELRRTMWNYVSIMRSDKRLQRARNRVHLLQEEIDAYYWDFKLTHDLIELRNLLVVAELVVDSAAHRRESRGLHFNIDTPQTSDEWQKPTRVQRSESGQSEWL